MLEGENAINIFMNESFNIVSNKSLFITKSDCRTFYIYATRNIVNYLYVSHRKLRTE